ncbi:MAG: helix-turn-helix domain-containing protein [Desulfosporosinus sp.]
MATVNSVAGRIGIVESGLLSSQRTTISGNLHISALYDSGKLFGLNAFGSSPGTWPMSFVAEINSTVLTFSMDLFMEDRMELQTLWRNLRIWRCIGRFCSDRWNRQDIRDIIRAAPTARMKILTFFDIMQDKFGSNTFKLRMSRDQFADFLNINRSSLFRELGRLQREGAIEIADETLITVNIS